MSIAVYYFTRTGISKRVAEKVAAELQCSPHCIDDGKNWEGVFGYVKAGFAAARKSQLPITYHPIGDATEITVVSPLWAGGLPPGVLTFMATVGKQKVNLIVTSLGSRLSDREGYISVTDIVGKREAEDFGN